MTFVVGMAVRQWVALNITYVSVLVQMSEGAMEKHDHDWYGQSCLDQMETMSHIVVVKSSIMTHLVAKMLTTYDSPSSQKAINQSLFKNVNNGSPSGQKVISKSPWAKGQ